jgi:hypothetical protein
VLARLAVDRGEALLQRLVGDDAVGLREADQAEIGRDLVAATRGPGFERVAASLEVVEVAVLLAVVQHLDDAQLLGLPHFVHLRVRREHTATFRLAPHELLDQEVPHVRHAVAADEPLAEIGARQREVGGGRDGVVVRHGVRQEQGSDEEGSNLHGAPGGTVRAGMLAGGRHGPEGVLGLVRYVAERTA